MIYAFADCELDTQLIELRRGGAPVPVEPQVFEVLRYFVEHPDRAVTKGEIYKHIWHGRIVSESALNSRIKSARQAIGDNGSDQRMIRTLRGLGFRFLTPVTTAAPVLGVGAAEDASAPIPESARTSIAVLPFRNLSDSPEQDYLADGVSDEIANLLSQHRWLQVIARGSSFALRDRDSDPDSIGRSLGVRYLLEGSVHRAGDQLRASAKLISALDGEQIWSKHYDRKITNIFELQDDIAQTIAATLAPELEEVEEVVASRKPRENLTAWDYYLRGRARLFEFTAEGLAEAERLFGRAVAIDPELASAHAGLSYVLIQEAFYGEATRRSSVLEAALASARRAVEADSRDAAAHFALGRAYSLRREFFEAEQELRTALDLNPSYAQAYFALGFTFVSSRRPAEAIPCFERFATLSPWDPHSWTNHHLRALAHYWLGDLDQAESHVRRSISLPNVTRWPFATLVSILGAAGKTDAARLALQRLRERKPDYSIAVARDDLFFLDDPKSEERFIDGLRAAGVPET